MQHFTPFARLALTALLILVWSNIALADDRVNILQNGGAEQVTNSGEMLPHWYKAAVPAPELRLWRATEGARTGGACLAISNGHDYNQKVSNNWAQNIENVPAGKTVHLSGYVRTRDAETANICVQCWGPGGKEMLGFGSTPMIRGSNDWTFVEAKPVAVPQETSKLTVRAALTGKGEAHFDDISLEIVDDAVPEDNESLSKLAKGRIVDTLPVVKDCMILAYMPNWGHGNVDNIAAANNQGGVRTLMAWKDPSPKQLSQKHLQYVLAVYVREAKASGSPAPLQMHEILADWKEMTSWERQPKIANKPVDQFEMSAENGWKLFDVTSFVTKRALARKKIFGVEFKFADENSAVNKEDYCSFAFVSREGIGEWQNRKPVLLVVDPAQTSDDKSDQSGDSAQDFPVPDEK
jgi:hypothetical protein